MKLKNLERKTKLFLENLARHSGPQLYELPVQDARAVLTDLQKGDVKKLAADVEDREILTGPDGKLSIRIVRPQGNKTKLPPVLYFHGGGWVLGDKNTHDRLVRELANGLQAAIVFLNYTPSPEAQFPKPIEEAYAATKYVAEHGDELNLDTRKLIIAGDSVGGNMAAVVALLSRERGGPKIDFQALFYPVTSANFDTPSYQEFESGYFLTKKNMEWFWDNYLPDKRERNQSHASPLHATLEELRDLPPALIINGDNDVLRDEGEAYGHKLMDAGVDVGAFRVHGTIHDFMMLNPITDTTPVRAAIGLAIGYIREVLKQGRAEEKKKAA